MELNKCNRCGAFFVSGGPVCPKCGPKDAMEMSTLRDYIQENGFTSLDSVSIDNLSIDTGITSKNLNRYLSTNEFSNFGKLNLN